MRTLLATVGTSLLTNRDDEPNARRRPWSGWRRGTPLPAAEDAQAYLATAEQRLASAETNTLFSLPLAEGDRIALLHSDTDEGRWCSHTLKAHYERLGHLVVERQIEQLGYREASFVERGLRGLLSVAFEELRGARERGESVVLCATGGFKAETAFMNLIGLLTGTPVLYIHEHFRDPIWMPRLPIAWDFDFVKRNAGFFDWIDSEPRLAGEVEPRLKAESQLRELVAESDDGCVYLTAAGDLLYRAYRETGEAGPRALWPPDSTRSPAEKNMLSSVEHHRPDGWERFVDFLTRVGFVEAVRYDGSAAGRGGPTCVWVSEPPDCLRVVYCRGDRALPLRVETTAKDAAALQDLHDWLSGQIRRRKW